MKSTFDKTEKVSRSVARKKENYPITTTSVIFSAKLNPRGPNVSKIINKHRHLLETDDTMKKLFPKKFYLLLLIKEEETCKNFSLEPTLTQSRVIY